MWLYKVPTKLSVYEKSLVDINISQLQKFIPKEFNRTPRLLKDFDRFKATEFRTLLFYIGIVIFDGIVS